MAAPPRGDDARAPDSSPRPLQPPRLCGAAKCEMPSLYSSYGVFPSPSAIRSKSSTELRDLYFKTSKTPTDVKALYFKNPDGTARDEVERAENFDQIHSIGKRNTKYLKFQKNTAPLVDRTACRYHKDFIAFPLGDNVVNRDLAAVYKAGAPRLQSMPSLGAKSNYSEQFSRATPSQMRACKMPSQAPKQTRTETLGGTGDTMVKTSSMHQNFQGPRDGMAVSCPSFIPKSNLTLSGKGTNQSFFKSMYKKDFEGARSQPLDPDWETYIPTSPPFAINDPKVASTRRMIYMSPGM